MEYFDSVIKKVIVWFDEWGHDCAVCSSMFLDLTWATSES